MTFTLLNLAGSKSTRMKSPKYLLQVHRLSFVLDLVVDSILNING
jgi:molybdopterin-guanine dinucleotide biosynthesis protein A